jgi:hypothetical protein
MTVHEFAPLTKEEKEKDEEYLLFLSLLPNHARPLATRTHRESVFADARIFLHL